MTIATPAPQVVSERGARVLRVPPPLYYTAGFAAGMLLLGTGVPLAFGASRATVITGAVLVAAGATLAGGGMAQVVRARTTIVPHRAVSALLTTGAYRVSRNPMYTGLAIAYLGGVLLAGSWWPLLTWPVALLAVRLLVIGPKSATSPADSHRPTPSTARRPGAGSDQARQGATRPHAPPDPSCSLQNRWRAFAVTAKAWWNFARFLDRARGDRPRFRSSQAEPPTAYRNDDGDARNDLIASVP